MTSDPLDKGSAQNLMGFGGNLGTHQMKVSAEKKVALNTKVTIVQRKHAFSDNCTYIPRGKRLIRKVEKKQKHSEQLASNIRCVAPSFQSQHPAKF